MTDTHAYIQATHTFTHRDNTCSRRCRCRLLCSSGTCTWHHSHILGSRHAQALLFVRHGVWVNMCISGVCLQVTSWSVRIHTCASIVWSHKVGHIAMSEQTRTLSSLCPFDSLGTTITTIVLATAVADTHTAFYQLRWNTLKNILLSNAITVLTCSRRRSCHLLCNSFILLILHSLLWECVSVTFRHCDYD